MKEQKWYIERSDLKGATHLEVSVYYSKGGMNYLTSGTSPRGYYLCVRPVTKRGYSIRFDLFAGNSQFLFGTNRFTDKQFERATIMAKDLEDELIAAVVAKNQAA